MDRERRRQDADRAYAVQVKAGTEGALRYTALGIGLAIMGHYTWPAFRYESQVYRLWYMLIVYSRRQTLALKGFLVSGCPSFPFQVGY